MQSPESRLNAGLKTAIALIALALGYHVTARLSLLLALPPGYVTAVWPAAGIALVGVLCVGYRVAPAVFVGSFSVNVLVSADVVGALLSPRALGIAAGIAAGATLQSIVGAWLIRRRLGLRLPLADVRSVALFYLLGGPIACLINSVIGNLVLLAAGSLAPADILYSWWTWWVGDVIGVLTVSPLILIWLGRPRRVWRARALPVGALMLLGFAGVVSVFVVTRATERQGQRDEFGAQAYALARTLQDRVQASVAVGRSVVNLYQVTPPITRAQFRTFVADPLRRYPALQALSWNPHVVHENRADYERAAHREGLTDFHFQELDATGTLVPASERAEYVVVQYIEPLAENARALGLDIASNPARRAALKRARDTGLAIATGRVDLVQGTPGILIFQAVYRQSPRSLSVAERRASLLGYAASVLAIDQLVDGALEHSHMTHVELRLYDETDSANPSTRVVQQRTGELLTARRVASDPNTPLPTAGAPRATPFDSVTRFEITARTWRLEVSLLPGFFTQGRPWYMWAVLAGGLLMTSLLGAVLLVVTGQSTHIKNQVAERTRELADANTSLKQEIEERKRALIALREAKDTAEAATRAKSDFLARMSHEIRTPMNAIMGMTQLIYNTELSARQAEHIDAVSTSAELLLNIINDILDFSKIEVGKLQLHPEAFSLPELLGGMQRLFSASLREAELTLHVDIGEVPPRLHGDHHRVAQVLMNLLGNAIKFTRPGGDIWLSATIPAIPATDPISADAAGDPVEQVTLVQFRVRDSGIGIPEQDRKRIFQAFEQADISTTRTYGGTGLGLAISTHLVALLGGRLTLESEVDVGSTFSFTIPLPVTDAALATDTDGADDPQTSTAAARSLHILLAEDNPINQGMARQILTEAGHRVTIASDGRAAIARYEAEAENLDVILMDLQMPDVDGIAGTRAIRAHERQTDRARTPIIAMTAHALPEYRQQCQDAGMDGYVTKPIDFAELLQLLDTAAAPEGQA